MTTQQRRRGPRGDLSSEVLLAAADRLLDSGGISGLTLRALARQAGVTPTVLYTYFEDMEDLRNQIGDRFLGHLDLTLLGQGTASEALHVFLDHVIETFDRAPGHAAVLASQRIVGPHALMLNEALLGFFVERVGHPLPMASGITGFLTEWVHGHVLLTPSNPATERFGNALARQDLSRYPRTMASFITPEGDALRLVVEALT